MLIPAVLAHYTSLALMANGRNTNAWEYLRKTTKFQSNGPVENLKWDAMLVILGDVAITSLRGRHRTLPLPPIPNHYTPQEISARNRFSIETCLGILRRRHPARRLSPEGVKSARVRHNSLTGAGDTFADRLPIDELEGWLASAHSNRTNEE
ncbi:glycoside hydrolase family 61 protein [Apiospora marii]|uniref:glycoside hydrolase family 61 protein n=1 Tax=Apiospora marii TaxID=335849 RepID=UPI003130DE83